MRNLPGWHSDDSGPCQSRTDQRLEVIDAKPGWNAQRSSHCAVLEAPFRHAWYIAEGQAVLLDQVVRRRRLAAPAQIIRRGADNKLDVVELAGCAKQGRPRAPAIVRALEKEGKTVAMGNASYGRSRLVAGSPLPSSSISFGMTLVMAIACGVAAANIYYNQPVLGIMEAAFPGQVTVIGLVPTATQLGFAAGPLLLAPLGDHLAQRRNESAAA
jgi:hypothetical protein